MINASISRPGCKGMKEKDLFLVDSFLPANDKHLAPGRKKQISKYILVLYILLRWLIKAQSTKGIIFTDYVSQRNSTQLR